MHTCLSMRSATRLCLAYRSFFAWPSGELSWNLETALKVYFLNEDEFLNEKKHIRLIAGEDIIVNHPRKRIDFIINLITLLLSAYPTTLDEDKVILPFSVSPIYRLISCSLQLLFQRIDSKEVSVGDGKSKHSKKRRTMKPENSRSDNLSWARRCALVLRIGQKQILHNVLEKARSELVCLSE